MKTAKRCKDDPRLPTMHQPGSRAKVEILCERARLRLPLFLEEDAMIDPTFAHRYSTDTGRERTPATAENIAAVLEMRSRGMTYRAIGQELGVWYTYVFQLEKRGLQPPGSKRVHRLLC